jgi:hypothetical protein
VDAFVEGQNQYAGPLRFSTDSRPCGIRKSVSCCMPSSGTKASGVWGLKRFSER